MLVNPRSEVDIQQAIISSHDVIESAKSAKLHYVSKYNKGISRKQRGKKFVFLDKNGLKINDELHISRIKALAIPPAWTDVWICEDPKGHLQATGIDVKGRKQYKYHQKFREKRDELKFDHMLEFATQLPYIRTKINDALSQRVISREKVISLVISLLEKTLIRVGNSAYEKMNHSYGLTTLKNKHVSLEGSEIQFSFRGKSGIDHLVRINDRRISHLIWKLKDLPGQNLFQYFDEEKNLHLINSSDVNEYLKEISGKDYTAKDFRTWYGTFYVTRYLALLEPINNVNQMKQNIIDAIKFASLKLGNTPSICKKCYVHPVIITKYMDGGLVNLSDRIKSISNQKEIDECIEKYILTKLEVT